MDPRIRAAATAGLGLLFWTAMAARSALGLAPDKAVTQYSLESWQIADGLPQNSVLDLIQSREGFLWLATYEGVARFDGHRFSIFEEVSHRPIRDQYVLTLHQDRQGFLWFGHPDRITPSRWRRAAVVYRRGRPLEQRRPGAL